MPSTNEYAPDGGNLPDAAETVLGNLRDGFESDPYAPTSWSKPKEYDFRCPSGQLVLLRSVDVTDLLLDGNMLNELDLLTGVVETEVNPVNRAQRRNKQAQEAKQAQAADANAKVMAKLKKDPEETKKFLGVLDNLVLQSVVKPKIHANPDNPEDRVMGYVYLDSVKFNDKMAIFNEAMKGTGDLIPFREEAEESP